MKVRRFQNIDSLVGLLVTGLAGSLAAQEARSQQKYSLSYTASPAASRYTEEHVIDVGDIPGHQVRKGANVVKFSAVETLLGGTGRFSRIRGTIRTAAERVVGAPALAAQFTGEHWFAE